MPSVDYTVTGWRQVVELFDTLGEASAFVGHMKYAIENDAPYTFFINYGYYRSGRPGNRRAGPAGMLEAGEARIQQLVPQAMVNNLLKGPTSLKNSLAGVMGEGTKATKAKTPVVSGRLRGGFHTVSSGRE